MRRLALLAILAGAFACAPPSSSTSAASGSVRADSVLAELRDAPTPPPGSDQTLAPLVLFPETPEFTEVNRRQIVVKFREGSAVRLNGAVLAQDPAEAFELTSRLTRQGVSQAAVSADLTTFSGIVRATEGELVSAGGRESSADLTAMRRAAEAFTGREHADLNLYYYVLLRDDQNSDQVLADIRRLRSVETAYFQPIPVNASDIPPQTTLTLGAQQRYFDPAPHGIDVAFAHGASGAGGVPGGRGDGMRIIDIEYGWHRRHEDFPDNPSGVLIDDSPCADHVNDYAAHGTAVIGVLWAEHNAFGISGITPAAQVGRISPYRVSPRGECYYSITEALKLAQGQARPGDIILIEQQIVDNERFAPVELNQENFRAIETITSLGIVVVEAGGNGGRQVSRDANLDSGAIMVGAGVPGTRVPWVDSNYGSRMDVQGWGQGIATLGYGTQPWGRPNPSFRINGADELQWYTGDFGGTSGASPMVAGAAAIIQANRLASGLAPLDSRDMRALLRNTGTAEPSPTNRIGPLPNLRTALAVSPTMPGQVGRR